MCWRTACAVKRPHAHGRALARFRARVCVARSLQPLRCARSRGPIDARRDAVYGFRLMPRPRKPARAESAAQALEQRLENRPARLAVIGLGYVGLPLAVELAQADV